MGHYKNFTRITPRECNFSHLWTDRMAAESKISPFRKKFTINHVETPCISILVPYRSRVIASQELSCMTFTSSHLLFRPNRIREAFVDIFRKSYRFVERDCQMPIEWIFFFRTLRTFISHNTIYYRTSLRPAWKKNYIIRNAESEKEIRDSLSAPSHQHKPITP